MSNKRKNCEKYIEIHSSIKMMKFILIKWEYEECFLGMAPLQSESMQSPAPAWTSEFNSH